jgi:SAM-dependent methyltransferase
MNPAAVGYFYPEHRAGGFTRVDGTVEFYTRVNSLLRPDMVVVDYGAGRGSGFEESVVFKRELRTLKGKVRTVIGMDMDDKVLTNPLIDEAMVISPDRSLPLPDASVDMIVSDAVFEHLGNPGFVAKEFDRALKPGGWICARTPNRWGYIGIGTNLVPNRFHGPLLRYLQPKRQEQDVFPTCYRLNTRARIRSLFPCARYQDYTYTWNAEPAYFAESKVLWAMMLVFFRVCPAALGAFLFVFLQKKPLPMGRDQHV